MRKFFTLFLLTALLSSCLEDRNISDYETDFSTKDHELVHYWSFNDTSTTGTLITPTFSNVSGAGLQYLGNYFDDVSEGSEINLRKEANAGSALRLRNPSGDFIMSLPSTGFKDLIFTFATTRTNNGAMRQQISYTTDGLNYTTEGLINFEYGVSTTFVKHQLDFSKIESANNNKDFKIKISFSGNADGESGNTRFDNITLDGIPTGEVQPPSVLENFHYWNFNNSSSVATLVTPNIGNGSITYSGSYYDSVEGSAMNVLNADPAGTALRLRNPSGDLIFNIPTTGYKDVKIKYAATRTSAGSKTQSIYYSLDGSTYFNSGIVLNITEEFSTFEIDLSPYLQINNNPNFKLKIVFDAASASASSGNNRIDNVTVEGYTL